MSTESVVGAWIDPRLQVAGARPWRKVHLDFHNTPAVGPIGAEFDPDAFVATLRAAHVDAVVVFAKDMHGWFYYPAARSAAVHPGLTRDLMGEQVAACRTAGIKVYAYYCTTWDNKVADEHPEWLVFKRDRTTYLPAFDETPHWTALCLRNEEFVQQMLDDTADLVTRYPVDGVWYDMPFPIDGECFCRLCLAALRGQGLDPMDVRVQRRDKQELLISWMRRSQELVQRLRPGCSIDQNNQTTLGLGERVPWLSNVDIEALPTGGWGYHYFQVDVRYARTFGTPVCGMTGRFHQAWADFGGLKHADQLRVELAGIVAQGAQICIGDQAPPSGRLDEAVYATIGSAYAEIESVQHVLDGAAPVVEAAVLVHHDVLTDPARIVTHAGSRSTTTDFSTGVVGAAELLLDERVQFDVVEADADLDHYRLLVVPDGTVVDTSLADRLTVYLRSGGALIVCGNALRLDGGDTAWVPGVDYHGESEFSIAYLLPDPAAQHRVPDYSYALYSGAGQYAVTPAPTSGQETLTVLARLGEPMFERTPQHFTSHGYAPRGPTTDYAVAWHQGRLGCFGFDIAADRQHSGYWVYRELFAMVLDAVLPDRLVRSDLPGAVEVSLTQRPGADGPETMLHLVPAFTGRRWGDRLDFYDRSPRLADVTVTLDLGFPLTRARPVRGDGVASVHTVDGRTVVTLSRLEGPEIVVLD